jgi:hypothetical protein
MEFRGEASSVSEAELLQAWRLKLLLNKRRQSEASVLRTSRVTINGAGPPPLQRRLSAPEDGLWAGVTPQPPAYQHHKGASTTRNHRRTGN